MEQSMAKVNISSENDIDCGLSTAYGEQLKLRGYKESISKGQRRYYLPSIENDECPSKNCQIFCGRIPTHMMEEKLFPLFERFGKIMDFQLMMNSFTDQSRGFAFITFADAAQASVCVEKLNNYKIVPGAYLNVRTSTPNQRLFVGNISKTKSKEAIRAEFDKVLSGIADIIVYSCPDDKFSQNRGFCFIDFNSHQAAARAKRRLESGKVRMFNTEMFVDWADPQDEPDADIMSMVKVLYVRNLSQEITEEKIREEFEKFGKIERVKKMKNYAFVHFEDRTCAIEAMTKLNGKELDDGRLLEVSLSKPPSDKKKKEELLRARERRMLRTQGTRSRSLSAHNNKLCVPPPPTMQRNASIFKNLGCWPQGLQLDYQGIKYAERPFFIS